MFICLFTVIEFVSVGDLCKNHSIDSNICFLFRLGFHCKFSNDGCNSDSECCSGRCLQKHEGTNHRCTPSMLHQPCVFNYHCLEGLECCERTYNCCSPIWRDCMSSVDCCDSNHQCVYVKGFTYKRCLTMDALASQLLPSGPLLLISVVLTLSWTSIHTTHIFPSSAIDIHRSHEFQLAE